MEALSKKRFYDIHFHVFNLSHPNLSSFVKRFILDNSGKLIFIGFCIVALIFVVHKVTSILFPVVLAILIFLGYLATSILVIFPSKTSTVVFEVFAWLLKRPLNTIAIMENDLSNYFLIVERELKENLLKDGKLQIGDTVYDKIVITPLMMDFGNKNVISKILPYAKYPIGKPIAQQVTDVFNGIRKYLNEACEHGTEGIFEIYPFLGINTKNYELDEINELLEKYFKNYAGKEADLCEKMGSFNGNIDEMNSNFFAGIKVYPPLGFDPMPVDDMEQKKVRALYAYCEQKGIPITTHCSDGGFKVNSFFLTNKFTSPEKWGKVLQDYPKLKLNLAHMGRQSAAKKILPRYFRKSWRDTVFELISKYDNVYTDFSCQGFSTGYYRRLKKTITKKAVKLQPVLAEKDFKLEDKILFGSDFMINLLSIDSYSKYIKIFQDTTFCSAEEKKRFCCQNPIKFLFHKKVENK